MIMSKQKRVDIEIVGGQRCLHQRKGESLDWKTLYEVGRSEMMREAILKRRASMSKTTRGKSNEVGRGD